MRRGDSSSTGFKIAKPQPRISSSTTNDYQDSLSDSSLEPLTDQKKERSDSLISTSYEEYYGSGTYSDRYKGTTNKIDPKKLLMAARRVLINKINNSSSNQQEISFNILDFGCGDGRYFHAIQMIAKDLHKIALRHGKTLKINYIGSDPISSAIEQYRKIIDKAGKYNTKTIKGTNKLKVFKYKSRQLNVSLIRNDLEVPNSQLFEAVGTESENNDSSIDLVMSMYGVLSHIPKKPKNEIISYFHEIMHDDAEIALTLPNKLKRFIPEQEASKKKGLPDGDLTYARDGFEGEIPYHVYSYNEVLEEFGDFFPTGRRADEEKGKLHISHTIEETTSTKDPFKAQADRLIAIGLIKPDELVTAADCKLIKYLLNQNYSAPELTAIQIILESDQKFILYLLDQVYLHKTFQTVSEALTAYPTSKVLKDLLRNNLLEKIPNNKLLLYYVAYNKQEILESKEEFFLDFNKNIDLHRNNLEKFNRLFRLRVAIDPFEEYASTILSMDLIEIEDQQAVANYKLTKYLLDKNYKPEALIEINNFLLSKNHKKQDSQRDETDYNIWKNLLVNELGLDPWFFNYLSNNKSKILEQELDGFFANFTTNKLKHTQICSKYTNILNINAQIANVSLQLEEYNILFNSLKLDMEAIKITTRRVNQDAQYFFLSARKTPYGLEKAKPKPDSKYNLPEQKLHKYAVGYKKLPSSVNLNEQKGLLETITVDILLINLAKDLCKSQEKPKKTSCCCFSFCKSKTSKLKLETSIELGEQSTTIEIHDWDKEKTTITSRINITTRLASALRKKGFETNIFNANLDGLDSRSSFLQNSNTVINITCGTKKNIVIEIPRSVQCQYGFVEKITAAFEDAQQKRPSSYTSPTFIGSFKGEIPPHRL